MSNLWAPGPVPVEAISTRMALRWLLAGLRGSESQSRGHLQGVRRLVKLRRMSRSCNGSSNKVGKPWGSSRWCPRPEAAAVKFHFLPILAVKMGNYCSPPAAPSPVTVHIYDVTGTAPMKAVNGVLRPFGAGVFHAAVEVHGKEWSYGQTSRGHGIFENKPAACQRHSYRESIHMGYTDFAPSEVQMLITEMAKSWPGREYNVISKNCCHFSDELCQLLGVGQLPSWVTNLADAASKVGPGLRELRERLLKPFCISRERPNKSGGDYMPGLAVAHYDS